MRMCAAGAMETAKVNKSQRPSLPTGQPTWFHRAGRSFTSMLPSTSARSSSYLQAGNTSVGMRLHTHCSTTNKRSVWTVMLTQPACSNLARSRNSRRHAIHVTLPVAAPGRSLLVWHSCPSLHHATPSFLLLPSLSSQRPWLRQIALPASKGCRRPAARRRCQPLPLSAMINACAEALPIHIAIAASFSTTTRTAIMILCSSR